MIRITALADSLSLINCEVSHILYNHYYYHMVLRSVIVVGEEHCTISLVYEPEQTVPPCGELDYLRTYLPTAVVLKLLLRDRHTFNNFMVGCNDDADRVAKRFVCCENR